ncbi:prepilin peptidase [Endozoicomonas montiporae]|uniref:Prepilin peptidase n=1 Tax=Endozoicomonas montiporae CL-33 TaxID=570277 RepID=A0A142BAZ7_9GAMM|nr:prepilin peptidase [Endozoicomonas montiporae]AMO55923.1 prepilin peptidase [Endozoicomonas montiporae CL-33]
MILILHLINAGIVVYSDVTRRVINNYQVLLVLILGLFTSGVANLQWGYWAVASIGLLLFFTGVVAGGDIKLLLAYLVGIDSRWWLLVFLLMAIIGGVLALGYLLYGVLINNVQGVRARGLPYGIPIVISGFIGVWLTTIS